MSFCLSHNANVNSVLLVIYKQNSDATCRLFIISFSHNSCARSVRLALPTTVVVIVAVRGSVDFIRRYQFVHVCCLLENCLNRRQSPANWSPGQPLCIDLFSRTRTIMDIEKEGKSVSQAKEEKTEEGYKSYARRWVILGIFVLYSASNSFQWIQFSIIANVIMKYYNVESTAVDWTSMIYMITYIPLVFPASYFLEKRGLRWSIILGATGTCLGAWVKAFSVAPDKYWITFVGQTITAVSQAFVLSVPAPLAAIWFGPDQVSTACSIGVFGNQLGVAVGFLVPPIFVKMHDNINDIGEELSAMFYTIASFTTVVLVMAVLFFKAEPPTPPSAAQAHANQIAQNEDNSFVQSVKRLVTSVPYILLVVSYGMNVGIYYAISTLLNQVIVTYYTGSEEDAGRIGLLLVVSGMAGSLVCGCVLDKTHKFKEVTATVYFFSLLSMILYTFTLNQGIIIVYIVSGVLGFFTTGYLPVGFELAAELTYPEPEGTSAGLLNAASQVFGIAFTTMYSWIFYSSGDKYANGIMCGMLAVGFVLTLMIKSNMKRQDAQNPPNNCDIP